MFSAMAPSILILLFPLLVCSAADEVKANDGVALNVAAATGDCDCGPHSSFCFSYNNQLTCFCKDGYSQTNSTAKGKCEKCDCGFGGTCTFVLAAKKKCDCRAGYAEVKGKCEECYCGIGGRSCKFDVLGAKKCDCWEGYVEKLGKCEVSRPCDCGEHGSCRYENGIKKCHCHYGYEERMGKCDVSIPPPCDCGEHGSCHLENGIKKCSCYDGYAERVGKCQECNCGEGKCEFVLGSKKCTCNKNMIEVRGKCQECDCGWNSISCKLPWGTGGTKQCTCKAGYAVTQAFSFADEECKKCECGPNGVSCTFGFLGKQTCDCKYGTYHTREVEGKKCKECDCGRDGSLSCWFASGGERRCECGEGYQPVKVTGSYWGDEYCSPIGIEDVRGGISGWRVGSYVLGAFFLITITGLVIAIINRNMSQSRAAQGR